MAQIVEHVERLPGVFIRLTRQAKNESAKWKPVMTIQNLHSFQDYVSPLVSFVRVSLSFHKSIEEFRTASLQTDDWISDPVVLVCRVFVSHMRVRNDQGSETFNDGWILYDGRHCDMDRKSVV